MDKLGEMGTRVAPEKLPVPLGEVRGHWLERGGLEVRHLVELVRWGRGSVA